MSSTTSPSPMDGGSQAEPQNEDQDAFSRYSNDILQMKALLHFTEDESADDDLDTVAKINNALRGVGLSGLTSNRDNVPKRRKGNSAVPIIDQQGSNRKTRLSWELHPSLVMYDMMEELEALESSHYIASDQGDDLKANGDEEHRLVFGQVQALFHVASVLVEEDGDEEAEKTAET